MKFIQLISNSISKVFIGIIQKIFNKAPKQEEDIKIDNQNNPPDNKQNDVIDEELYQLRLNYINNRKEYLLQFEKQDNYKCLCGLTISNQELQNHKQCHAIVECFICKKSMIELVYLFHIQQDHKEQICLNCGQMNCNFTNQNHKLRCFQVNELQIDDAKMQQQDSQKNDEEFDQYDYHTYQEDQEYQEIIEY